MTSPISLKRAALWGAIASPLILIVRFTLTDRWPREGMAFQIGYLIGSVAGGALIFVAAAALINALKR